MQPVIYTDACQYIVSAATQVDRLERLGQIIDAFLVTVAAAAIDGNLKFEEYQLNDGQTQLRVRYRSAESFQKAIEALTALEEVLLARLNNQANGRSMRLVDISNFTGGCYGRR